jgi:hypothetical protein
MKFLTENNIISTPLKTLFGLTGYKLAVISPTMQDVHWWMQFTATAAGMMVAVASAVSLCIGVYRQVRKIFDTPPKL